MKEKIKVIFDTNSIRTEPSKSYFFGFRSELEKFSAVADIIIPDMVIDEIKAQKVSNLISSRDQFISNPFHGIKKLEKKETLDFDIESYVTNLLTSESIDYTVIFLTKIDSLVKIKEFCHKHEPPFDEKGDKGFKDVYIYLTILEYLESITNEQVFFVTRDAKLKEAFEKIKGITIIENFEEFEKFNISSFNDEYFINKLKEEVSDQITNKSITNVSTNVDGNWVLKIDNNEFVSYVLVDFNSREIINFTSDFIPFVNALTIAGNFQTVHNMVAELDPYKSFFSDKDILVLLNASISNDQIYQIAKDEDVNSFFIDLFTSKKHLLDTEGQETFEAYFIKKYERR